MNSGKHAWMEKAANWTNCIVVRYLKKNFDLMLAKIVDHLLPLPPKIFLNSGTEAADEVVEIHEHMNTHVQESYEWCVSTTNPSKLILYLIHVFYVILVILLDSWPGSEGHDTMVDNMESGEVGELLPQQEEERIKIINKLWQEEPPDHVQFILSISRFLKNNEINWS